MSIQKAKAFAQSLHSACCPLVGEFRERAGLAILLAYSIVAVMENGSRHVIMLRSSARETLHRRKYLAEELRGRAENLSFTNGLQPLDPEALAFDVERV